MLFSSKISDLELAELLYFILNLSWETEKAKQTKGAVMERYFVLERSFRLSQQIIIITEATSNKLQHIWHFYPCHFFLGSKQGMLFLSWYFFVVIFSCYCFKSVIMVIGFICRNEKIKQCVKLIMNKTLQIIVSINVWCNWHEIFHFIFECWELFSINLFFSPLENKGVFALHSFQNPDHGLLGCHDGRSSVRAHHHSLS